MPRSIWILISPYSLLYPIQGDACFFVIIAFCYYCYYCFFVIIAFFYKNVWYPFLKWISLKTCWLGINCSKDTITTSLFDWNGYILDVESMMRDQFDKYFCCQAYNCEKILICCVYKFHLHPHIQVKCFECITE